MFQTGDCPRNTRSTRNGSGVLSHYSRAETNMFVVTIVLVLFPRKRENEERLRLRERDESAARSLFFRAQSRKRPRRPRYSVCSVGISGPRGLRPPRYASDFACCVALTYAQVRIRFPFMSPVPHRSLVALLLLCLSPAGSAVAQVTPAAQDVTKLPSITVTAQKEAQPLQSTPASVTAAPRSFLEDAGIRYINDVAMFAPNIYLTEWSARKLSNPRFRGVGSSPNNPGVTTYLDGVPQLNANTSSLEFIDVDQVEIVRGPQGALFGRNTVGGVINITSVRPALTQMDGEATVGFGNHGWRDARFDVTTPVAPGQAGISFAGGYTEREGFATNPVTGHDLDWRKAYFGK